MKPRIVVVGGGFAGFWAAIAARRVGSEALDIVLVSPDPTLKIRPRLYEAAPETLSIDLRPLLDLAGIAFQAGEARAIDAHALTLSDGRAIPFDRAVIATGSAMRSLPVRGADLAHSIDTQADAVAFDTALREASRKAAPRIAVIGAGFTGIEVALELRDRIAGHAGCEVGEAAHIVLVDRSEQVGAELGAGPRPAILRALEQAAIELRLGAGVAAIEPEGLLLAGGQTIAVDLVVLAVGLEAAPFAGAVGGACDELGRLRVAHDLAVIDRPGLFAAGDAARALTDERHPTLMSCQHALQTGRFAGENAARDLLGMPTLTYRQHRYVTCLALGRSGAVLTEGWERVPVADGAEAASVKRHINTEFIYPPRAPDLAELLALSRPG